MKCSQCHQEAPTDAAFCPRCGTKLSVICLECRTANALDHSFCKQCGKRLAVIPASPPVAGRFTSPQAYTPRYLAEKILTSKSTLEGDRKQLTVLLPGGV